MREQIRKAGFTPGKIEVSDVDDGDITQSIKGQIHLVESSDGTDEKQAALVLQIVTQDSNRSATIQADDRADRRESYDLLKAFANNADTNKQPIVVVAHVRSVEDQADMIFCIGGSRWILGRRSSST